jgi:thiamine pyrophosphokinase
MPAERALIFVNGEQINLPAVKALVRPADFRIAADGGLRFLNALGLRPHLLIGDLDSVDPEDLERLRQAGDVRIEQHPAHKDETDLELAVLAAVSEGCQAILLLGALGGRLDMTLANIFLLALPELSGIDARLEDGLEEVFLIEPGQAGRDITGRPGDRVSLLPWGGPAAGVRTSGLHYPLRGETLFPEHTRGISNVMIEQQAHVSLETGRLICIHTRKQFSKIHSEKE